MYSLLQDDLVPWVSTLCQFFVFLVLLSLNSFSPIDLGLKLEHSLRGFMDS